MIFIANILERIKSLKSDLTMVTNAPFIVYALIDPESYDVRYIGKSCSMFRRARAMHTARCGSWMKSLKARGLEPIVRVLGFL